MTKVHRSTSATGATRRQWLVAGAVLLVRPVGATTQELAVAINGFTGGAPVRAGRVTLEVAPLVENGNTVPMTVSVDSAMSVSDHVISVSVFNERNPQREVVNFFLGPRAGRAVVASRIRLATSQQLVAVAKMNDGSFWSHSIDVVVTLAACVE